MAVLSSPIARSHYADLLIRGIDKIYADEWPIDFGEYRDLYNFMPADKMVMNHVMMSGFGLWNPQVEGAPPQFDTSQEAYKVQLTVTDTSLGFIITRQAQRDNLYQGAFNMTKDLAQSGAYTQDVDAIAPLNNMTTTTVYTLDATDFPLISTAHGRVDGGTWANRPTSPMDLSLESVEFARAHWHTNMVDHRGRKRTGVLPKTLWHGVSDWSIALRICSRNGRPFGNNNEPNVLQSTLDLMPKMLTHLTDDGRWGLLGPKEKAGLYYHTRLEREIRKETEPITGNLVVIGNYAEAHAAVHPHFIWASP